MNHFTVYLKLIQHCKNQLYFNFKKETKEKKIKPNGGKKKGQGAPIVAQ